MASKAEPHREAFTDKQLKAITERNVVDAADVVDLVVARDIGLMTEDTRLKIEAKLAGHNALFKAAKDRILTSGNPAVEKAAPVEKNAVAIRLAFEQIYGKFLFEEEYRETDPQYEFAGHLEHKLHHLLKVEIKEGDGIKGRNELIAARRRLMMLNATESTDPTKAAEIAANRARIEGELRKMEKTIALFEKVRTAPGKSENYTMVFKTIPKFLKLIIDNKADYDPAFVTKCEQYQTDFAAFLPMVGLTPPVNKADFSSKFAHPDFTLFKDGIFDDFSKELVAFVEENLPKLKTELTKKEEELGMASFPTASAVLNEAFTITKALTPEEIEAKFKKAQTLLDSVPVLTAPNPGAGKVEKARKLLTESSNKVDLNKAIVILRNILGFFGDKKDQKNIESVIDNLEQVVGISPEVLIERATTRKKEAEAKVAKAESVRTYFETDHSSAIKGALDTMIAATQVITPSSTGGAPTSTPKEILNAANVFVKCEGVSIRDMIVELSSVVSSQGKLEGGKGTAAEKKAAGDRKAIAEKDLAVIKGLIEPTKALFTSLLIFTENATFLAKNNFLDESYKVSEIDGFHKKLQGMNPETSSTSINDLKAMYEALDRGLWFNIFKTIPSLKNTFAEKMTDYKKDVKAAEKDLKKKEEALHAVHDLSDTAAAKRIIFAVVKRQHPELSLEDQDNLANLILADDVAKIQAKKGYEDLAKEGSEDLEGLVKNASELDFRWKVLKFKYQVDGKVFEPFKGLKPADLNNWAKIEKQFAVAGKFDYQSGFYFLAAMNEFFGENKGTFTVVYKKLENKLKSIIAERVGASKRMGDAYVSRLVDETFEHQLKESRELMRAHFDNYDRNKGDINSAKVKELKHRLKELKENRKLGKIDQEQFEEKYEKLVKEAKEYGVEQEMDFVEDVFLSGYFNSPQAQWLKDLGMDVSRYGKDKSVALLKGTAMTGLHGAVGAVNVGGSLALQYLATPFRLLKYPLFIAAKPAAGFINLFRKDKLTPPGIIDTMRSDLGRVGKYFRTLSSETFEGAKTKTAASFKEPWAKAQFKRVKYPERSKVKLDVEAARIKEYGEKAELKPLEIAHAPTIDFEAIRKKIEENDKASGNKTTLEPPKSGEDRNKGEITTKPATPPKPEAATGGASSPSASSPAPGHGTH
jgi:hypothetical protein